VSIQRIYREETPDGVLLQTFDTPLDVVGELIRFERPAGFTRLTTQVELRSGSIGSFAMAIKGAMCQSAASAAFSTALTQTGDGIDVQGGNVGALPWIVLDITNAGSAAALGNLHLYFHRAEV
jgi:hypothetical protein